MKITTILIIIIFILLVLVITLILIVKGLTAINANLVTINEQIYYLKKNK